MANEKIIAAIGASDEEIAHLRLLMRQARLRLGHAWRWGSEVGADLLVIDTRELAGQMARTRAHASGIRCALLCDPDDAPTGELLLRRPFRLDNVIEVLERAVEAAPALEILPQEDEFYFRDLEIPAADPAAITEETPILKVPAPPVAGATPGLDDLLKAHAAAEERLRPDPRLTSDTLIIAAGGSSARSESRMRDAPDALRPGAAGPNPLPAARPRGGVDHTRHPFKAYLDGGLLGGPSRTVLPGAPALTLDPKHQMYHAKGELRALEAYVAAPLRRSAWIALTSAEMAHVRETEPAQPYIRLIWLDALVRSGGRLAGHLDPGGSYRLIRWLEIEHDYPQHLRIAAAMVQPARLNEIAAASGASMAEVFDLVNAYDAIGYLEWQRRPPRHGDDKPAREGFLQRLRKPFGKG